MHIQIATFSKIMGKVIEIWNIVYHNFLYYKEAKACLANC